MTIAILQPTGEPLSINLAPMPDLTEADFIALCQSNPDLNLERAANGEILIMPPEGGESGHGNALLVTRLTIWSLDDGRGVTFGSSVGFRLPDGAIRSPDAAWVSRLKLDRLSAAEKRAFLPLCPDFVIELRSPTDRLADLQAKMEAYLANGAQLGWLIDPAEKSIHIYRPGRAVELLIAPTAIDGGPELPGFHLDLAPIWSPGF